jgi:hypothetical protein
LAFNGNNGVGRGTEPHGLLVPEGRLIIAQRFRGRSAASDSRSPGSSSLFRPVGAREEVCGLMFPGRWPGLT